MGSTRDEITIDIVNCGGFDITPSPHQEANNAIGNFMTAHSISHYYD
jgi:hypothetical protein